jgi:hypothetical protein
MEDHDIDAAVAEAKRRLKATEPERKQLQYKVVKATDPAKFSTFQTKLLRVE